MKKFALIFEIVALFVSIYVGMIYYSDYSADIIKYSFLIIENALSCFVLNSKIKLLDIINIQFFANQYANLFVFSIYALCIYIAPICLMSQFLMAFTNLRYSLKSFIFNFKCLWAKEIIIIVGYNEKVKKILDNECVKNRKYIIFVYTKDEVSIELKNHYMTYNIKIFHYDFASRNNTIINQTETTTLKKVKHIMMFKSSVLDNINIIDTFIEKISNKKLKVYNEINIYIGISNYQSKVLLQHYLNNLEKIMDKPLLNYEIFNLSHEIVKCLCFDNNSFDIKSIYDNYVDDMHSVIIGFGELGVSVFESIINNSLYSSTNTIRIDVIDNDINNAINLFLKRIKKDYVRYILSEKKIHFKLSNNCHINDIRCDGSLDVYFHQLDIYDNNLLDEMYKINASGSNDIDDIYICLKAKDINLCIDCLNNILEFRLKKQNLFSKKIYIRLESKNGAESFINNRNDNLYHNVIPFFSTSELLRIDYIINNVATNKLKLYNSIISQVGDIAKKAIINRNYDVNYLLNNTIIDLSEEVIENLWRKKSIFDKEKIKFSYINYYIKNEYIKSLFLKVEDDYYSLIKNLNVLKFDKDEIVNKYLKSDLFKLLNVEHRRETYFYAFNGWRYSDRPDEDYRKKESYKMLCYKNLCKKEPEYIIYELLVFGILIKNKKFLDDCALGGKKHEK